MEYNHKVAAMLSTAVYYDKGRNKEYVPSGWTRVDGKENAETGFLCALFIAEDSSSKGGASVFAVMGTSSTAGKDIAKGQMKSNAELREDPEHDMGIVKDTVGFVKEATARLAKEKGGTWKHYLTGHSLGGMAACCALVACSDIIEECVTFESPGMIKYWRDKASKGHDEQYWKKKLVEYVSFPNPINTCLPHVGAVSRLHMAVQAGTSPGHVVRCAVGTSLRFMVWVSVANVVAAAAGRAKGFWAAKVGSVTVKLVKLVLARKLTPSRIKHAFGSGLKDDQASKDSRAAEQSAEVRLDDPAAKPMKPILGLLPQKARPGFIVGFWALVTAAGSNAGYMSMRTLAQINDTMAEHSVDTIAQHFDEKTGEPKCATPMASWPYHEIMIKGDLPGEHMRRCMLEGLTPFHPTAYGFHNLLRREKLLVQRASTMPGFKEA